MTEASSMFDLQGRTILITGAAGGIGGATARLCVEQGAEVVLVGATDVRTIEDRVGSLDGRSRAVSCDVGRREAVVDLAARIGPVYGIVDCAAICPDDDWLADDFDRVLDQVLAVNVKGPLNLARTFFPPWPLNADRPDAACFGYPPRRAEGSLCMTKVHLDRQRYRLAHRRPWERPSFGYFCYHKYLSFPASG